MTIWLNAFLKSNAQIISDNAEPNERRISLIRGFEHPQTPGRLDLQSVWNNMDWLQINEIRYFAEDPNRITDTTPTLIALNRLGRMCGFLISGDDSKHTLSLGIEKDQTNFLRTSIGGNLEVIMSDFQPPRPDFTNSLTASLIYSGIPSHNEPKNSGTAALLPSATDRVLQTLRMVKKPWLFMLLFQPVDENIASNWGFSVSKQIFNLRIKDKQPGTIGSYNRVVEQYEALLEDYLTNLQLAVTEGGWLTYGIVYAHPQAIQHVHAALAAAYAGSTSLPEPWRLRPAGSQIFSFDRPSTLTFLPSSYLARMTNLPTYEHPGIAVTKTRRFDLIPPLTQKTKDGSVTLGNIVDGTVLLEQKVQLDLSSLSTHVFVAGITGSGKSTTIQTLISQAAQQDVKILIIEPVKREYRHLNLPGLRVFSIGDPGCQLELNPFVFEGVACSTHLDHLKSLFAAAYVLYPPMPYVLEQALYEVYQEKGWDFTSGLNWRSPKKHPRSYPNLTSLLAKIGEVIARSGYGPRLEPEIKAALEMRINNLRIGAKGALLDTPRSFSLEELIQQPTVLELQGIGDPEQRAFLMGLLLTKIYEGSIASGPSQKLRLLIIIEEAHRLLEEKPGNGEDFANPQAKAIEAFGDMLAELRAYGVGLIIAEQSPSRITQQVLKNTATKFAHQLVDATERDLMAGAMVLTEDERLALATLPRGHMLMFSHGMNRPMHIAVDQHGFVDRKSTLTEPVDPDIIMAKRSALKAILQDDPRTMHSTLRLVAFWLFADFHDEQTLQDQLMPFIQERMFVLANDPVSFNMLAIDLIKHNLDKIVAKWGTIFGWPFETETRILSKLCTHAEQTITKNLPLAFPGRAETLALMKASKPFAGCRDCSSPCEYRSIAQFLEINLLTSVINLADRDKNYQQEVWLVSEQVNGFMKGNQEKQTNIQRCFLAHAASHSNVPRERQAEVVSLGMLQPDSDL